MDKIALPMVELLKEMLEAYERLLAIAKARRDAMRAYDITALNVLAEREREQMQAVEKLEGKRKALIAEARKYVARGVEPTVSEVARGTREPLKTQLVILSGKLKGVVEDLERLNRINSKISTAVVGSIAKVLKVVTGMAQHAGLYMRDGRKATIHGIHLLDAVA